MIAKLGFPTSALNIYRVSKGFEWFERRVRQTERVLLTFLPKPKSPE